MKKRILLSLWALALVPAVAGAQPNFAGVTYNFSFPAVDIDRYVGQDSWYGVTVDFRRHMTGNPNLLLGITSGWYVFYDNVNQVIALGNGAISGDQYRNFNIVPILVNATYLLGDSYQTRPYFALHAGPYYARQQLDIGLYSITQSNWHFGLAPEFGVTFPMQTQTEFYFNLRYHYLFAAGDYLGGQSLTLPFFTLGAGFAWAY